MFWLFCPNAAAKNVTHQDGSFSNLPKIVTSTTQLRHYILLVRFSFRDHKILAYTITWGTQKCQQKHFFKKNKVNCIGLAELFRCSFAFFQSCFWACAKSVVFSRQVGCQQIMVFILLLSNIYVISLASKRSFFRAWFITLDMLCFTTNDTMEIMIKECEKGKTSVPANFTVRK